MQYAVKNDEVFVLEANPRASRTVPFVAKATGVAVAQVAVRVMMGHSLASMRREGTVPNATPVPTYVSVKEAVLPFSRFPGVDTVLGPEMRSTGEVMGIGESFGIAFAKSQLAAGTRLPDSGQVFFSLADRDKVAGLELARELSRLGFKLAATVGTAGFLRSHEVSVDTLGRQGRPRRSRRSTPIKLIASGEVQMVVNTPSGSSAHSDGAEIRTACVGHGVACVTTLSAGFAAAKGIADTRAQGWRVHIAPGAARVTSLATSVGVGDRCVPAVLTASGTAGYGDELAGVRRPRRDLGAVVTKSLASFAWEGNPAPRVAASGVHMVNAVGLAGPGVSAWREKDLPALEADAARRSSRRSGAAASRSSRTPPRCCAEPRSMARRSQRELPESGESTRDLRSLARRRRPRSSRRPPSPACRCG